jgi:streptomycin 3"-adenylyltransferase
MRQIEDIIEDTKSSYYSILKDNLVGIYIHGSYAMNSFYPSKSDLDFIVVVYNPLSDAIKRLLVEKLIDMTPFGPEKGFEMSVILHKDALHSRHPMPFEVHFSNGHIERYKADKNYICGNDFDDDLIAHIKVIKERGIVLYGKVINRTFGEIKDEYFIDSIYKDIKDSKEKITEEPVYYSLNLIRFLLYLKNNKIYSKIEGGKIALEQLPAIYKNLIFRIVESFEIEAEKIDVDLYELKLFAGYMLEEIDKEIEIKASLDNK